ncbi:MAG: hypothetical protein ABJE66_29935 [Deltaproteobacteria bacterium]
MWSSFVAILLKEFKHIFRDRGTLIIFFTLPIMQLALFGFLDQNVRDLPTVVVDQDQSRVARADGSDARDQDVPDLERHELAGSRARRDRTRHGAGRRDHPPGLSRAARAS